MPEVYGVENLKKLIKFGCGFTKQVSVALEDGKFQWNEAFGFIDEVMEIPNVVKSFAEVKKELSELSETEIESLHAYLVEEFDLPNDAVEAFVENSVLFAISALALVEQWKALKTPPVV